jgi:hypothetical protein
MMRPGPSARGHRGSSEIVKHMRACTREHEKGAGEVSIQCRVGHVKLWRVYYDCRRSDAVEAGGWYKWKEPAVFGSVGERTGMAVSILNEGYSC